MIRAVVLDIGETIISEARLWTRWAERLGVRPIDFFAVLGSIIERGGHHREVFEHFEPGFDVDAAMAAEPVFGSFDADDLYPDARPCLVRLREAGYRVGLAGNQPERAESALEAMDLPVDFIASSRRWGVAKPSPAFYEKVADGADVEPREMAYVGDRVDNDVIPAAEAGMVAVFIRRGPWGEVQARHPDVERADVRIESLDELPAALG